MGAAEVSLSQRWASRAKSVAHLRERFRADPRNLAYDLLPLIRLKGRDALVRFTAPFRAKGDWPLDAEGHALLADLRRDGFTALQGPLPAHQLADMVAYFQATPCHDPYRPHLGRFPFDAPPSDECNMGFFTWEEVIRAPHMLALANDPRILAVAERYLGSKPVLDNIGASWSYPGREQAKGGQRFHRDYDNIRSVKLFLYLTDVDEGAGPHMFVRGSHASPLLETPKAIPDSDVDAAFGVDSVKTFCAKAGQWFLEDVYGIHKGLLPTTTPRLLVALEYNVFASPLSPQRPVMRAEEAPGLDPDVNRLFVG